MNIIFEIIIMSAIFAGVGYGLCWCVKEAMRDIRSEKTKGKSCNSKLGNTFNRIFSIIFIFMGIAFIIIGLFGEVPFLVMGVGLISLGILIIIGDKK